ncbi:MAG TPA: hypothetical protein DCE18_07635 [Syntrophobacteraceae bacterium]|jgi:hypothetical protein|nr:hypothetical protein [Syntrophobacteraceae bacterium]
MIDHSRIVSGYDAEILLGAEYFRKAIDSWFDSGLIEATQELPYGATATIGRATQVELRAGTIAVPQREGDPVNTDYTMVIHFPAHVTSLVTGPIDLALAIHIAVVLDEQTSDVTGLVNRVQMRTRYVAMDETSRATIISEVAKNSSDEIGREAVFAVDERLAAIFEQDFTDQLIMGNMQKMAVRQLPEEPGFQSCYAIYVNFNLKLGNLFDLEHFPLTLLVLPPEPDEEPVDRGDAALGRNFLPYDRDVAMGSPAEIYNRLATNQMHAYTEQKADGSYYRPLKDGMTGAGEVIGLHRGLDIEPNYLFTQPLGGFKITSKTHLNAMDGVNVETRIYVKLSIADDGSVKMDVDVSEPEADTSFFDFLIGFIGGLVGLLTAPLTGGMSLIGFGMLTGITLGMTRIIKEREEEKGREMVQKMVESQQDDLFSFLSTIPSRVTIVPKRVSPFHHHNYQVVTQFKEVNILRDGISFAGVATNGEEDVPIEAVTLAGRRRLEEPTGELTDLFYRVPNYDKIIGLDQFKRPNPDRYPDLFELTLDAAAQWVADGKLKRSIIRPAYVRLRSDHITEIYFDSRVGLAPFEAGNLQINRVLWVRGFKLIIPRNGRPYYRSNPDKYQSNNLSSLPVYECWRSRIRADEFIDVTNAMIGLAQGSWGRVYQNGDPGDSAIRLISEQAYRFASAYPMIQALITAMAEQQPIPPTTFYDLDHAAYDPEWPVDEMSPVDAENWLPRLVEPLAAGVATLDDEALDLMAHVPLIGDTVTTHWLTGRLLDHLWYWYGLVFRGVWEEKKRQDASEG